MLADNRIEGLVQTLSCFLSGPEGQNCIIVCGDSVDVETVHFAISTHFVGKYEYKSHIGAVSRDYKFSTGQSVYVRCMESLSDAHKYGGMEFSLVVFIDLESLDHQVVNYMTTRCRVLLSVAYKYGPANVAYTTDRATGSFPVDQFASWYPHFISACCYDRS